MASMTAQGTLPTAGSDINAEPLTDTYNHIMNTYNGNNADENNVDYTSSDGIMVLAQAQTRTGQLTMSSGALIFNDNINLTFGTGSDATIDYDGTDVILDPRVVGSGVFRVLNEGQVRGDAGAAGILNLQTAETTVVDGDKLGQINFQAPLEASGTDAILVAASIWAEADDTFAADNNDTDLVFAVAESETAAEAMRLAYDGTGFALTFNNKATSLATGGNNNLALNAGTADVVVTASNLTSASNDGGALGISGTGWSDLFLASGAVINFAAGDVTVTHSSGKLTMSEDEFIIGADPTAVLLGIKTTTANSTAPLAYLHAAASSGTDNQPVLKVHQDYASATGPAFKAQSDATANQPVHIQGGGFSTGPIALGGGQVGINDDAVTTLTTSSAGILYLTAVATAGGAHQATGIIAFNSGYCAILAQQGGVTIAASTSDLSGTTGADGQITVSRHAGGLEVENRVGTAITVRALIQAND